MAGQFADPIGETGVNYILPGKLKLVRSGDTSGEVRAFPVYRHRWSSDEEQRHVAWILYRYDRDSNEERYALLWPLAQKWDSDEESGRYAFPFFYHRHGEQSGTTNVFGPVYHRTYTEDRQSTHFLWPLGQVSSDETTRRSYLLPFYYSEVDQTEGVRSVYTPLASWRDDGSFRNFGLFLYHMHEKDDRRYSSLLWPVTHRWSGPDEAGGSSVLPFYYYNTDGDENRSFLTLAGGQLETPDRRYRTFLGPVYYEVRDKEAEREYQTVAWPFWHRTTTPETDRQVLIPLYYRRQTEDSSRFASLPYTRRSGPEMLSQSALLGLIGWGHDESREHRHHRVLPFYRCSHTGTETETQVVGGLGAWRHNPATETRSHHLLPFYESQQTKVRRNLDVGPGIIYTGTHNRLTPDQIKSDLTASLHRSTEASTIRTGEESEHRPPMTKRTSLSNREWLLSWITSTRRLVATAEHLAQNGDQPGSPAWQIDFEEQSHARWWPFYHREQKGDREARREILWRLYDSRTIAPDEDNRYSRRRVLWRVWHQQQSNSHVSTDFFPFVSVDRNREEELFRWSFAVGLLGMHRQGEERRFRLLYFRLGGKSSD